MRPSRIVRCPAFPCADVRPDCFIVPNIDLDPKRVRIAMISEAAPLDPHDYYYAKGDSLFQRTTVQAFNDAGVHASSIHDILKMGVYLTTAVKCGKTSYAIKAGAIEECSHLLEKELDLFPALRVYMLMGDVAIKALNAISRRKGMGRAVPAGPTYRIRSKEHWFGGRRALPSYLQAGPSFFIEKSKRRMIAEDIATALSLIE